MKIAHIGPPLARQGGPAGYLLQLQRAAADAGATDVYFPDLAPARPSPAGPAWPAAARRALGRVKRRLLGPPRFDRPPAADIERPGGLIESLVVSAQRAIVEECAASMERAARVSADVWFCHDTAAAAHVLARRDRPVVWLFQHAPFPLALYLVWSWGVPERAWDDLLQLPDVRKWTAWETDVWNRVDRFVLPCREAREELVRIDPTAASLACPVEYVLTGARVKNGASFASPREQRRRRLGFGSEPVALFVGNNQPYRGLDTLVAGLERLSARDAPGIVAVAGPDADTLPSHPRLRALGPVSDMAGLLDAVDFVVNVNRFSLFDLSTVEAVEAGRPLLLHAVGGNKTFKALGAGCVMIDDLAPETVANGLRGLFTLPSVARLALGAQSRACYEAHLTPAHFWQRHAELYSRAAMPPRRVAVS